MKPTSQVNEEKNVNPKEVVPFMDVDPVKEKA